MTPKYELLPTEPDPTPLSSRSPSPAYPPSYDSQYLNFDQNADVEDEVPFRSRARREPIPSFDSDPRFHQPTPSPYARAALLLFMFFLFWLAFAMRKALWVEAGMGMGKGPPEEVDSSY
ncbi:hypothetical protein B0H34DRAFT_675558 [Crassisporium funariophilum]|nr:hypothetical protein B0H34DRAFT_675558 [Crassisporium funariophilum]